MGGSNSTHAHSNYLICMYFIGISTVCAFDSTQHMHDGVRNTSVPLKEEGKTGKTFSCSVTKYIESDLTLCDSTQHMPDGVRHVRTTDYTVNSGY